MWDYSRFRVRAIVLALTALGAMIAASEPASAAGPWYVASAGDDANDCLSPVTPCATINVALAKTDPGDTVLAAIGTYTGTGNEVVLLSRDVILSGGWNATFTKQNYTSTIDGEGARRGITIETGVSATVDRFIVQNGFRSSQYVAADGGGIRNEGTLLLIDIAVRGNDVAGAFTDGGGIENTGVLTLNNSTISDNRAIDGTGGGIRNSGSLTLNNSSVIGNKAQFGGGGIRNVGTLALNNSTVSGNTAGGNGGGGISNWFGTLALANSAVVNNTSISNGGGISRGDGTVTLKNSMIAGNTAIGGPDCWGIIGSGGYNFIANASGCDFTPDIGDLTNITANLGELIRKSNAPAYHPLFIVSQAINAGDPSGCTDNDGNPLPNDQRGATRVGRCDMGPYEYTNPGSAISALANSGTPQHTALLSAFMTPMQAVVMDNLGSPVIGALVTFSAPTGGASGTFQDTGTNTTTAFTDEGGLATAATFVANESGGGYSVTAYTDGVEDSAEFLLANHGWYVTAIGDDANDCQTPATACASIGEILGMADFISGDRVWVASGTYTGAGSDVVMLDSDVTISGGWDETFTEQNGASTIDGERARRGIRVIGTVTAILERLSIENGSALSGAGILNDGGYLTLDESRVISNVASGRGGGIRSYGSSITILNNNTIDANTAASGGGISNEGFTMTLNDSTVSGNTTIVSGGGGIANRSAISINWSTISDNMSFDLGGFGTNNPDGGGIHNSIGASLTLINSTVSGNSSTCLGYGFYVCRGGGIFMYSFSSVELRNSIVSDNVATVSGGGIEVGNSSLIVADSTIRGNLAGTGGGIASGISDFGGTMLISNSTVSGNISAGHTGGIHSVGGGKLTMNNSTVSGNTAAGNAGGIFNFGEINLNSVTITNNRADSDGSGVGDGGGIYIFDSFGNTITVSDTIIGGNMDPSGEAPDCSGSLTSKGYNIVQDLTGCDLAGSTDGDVTGIDPNLGPLLDNGGPTYTHALLPGSLAINAGDPAGCTDHLGELLATDQRGLPRVGRCDMGAFEYQGVINQVFLPLISRE